LILRIDTESSTPVYAQIVDQIKRAIASGILANGDSLPSLRELALKLRINPLTVNKAYKHLENEGLIETRHGLGSFVAADTRSSTEKFRRETLTRATDDLLVDAFQMGVSFDEVKELLEERIEAAKDDFARDLSQRRDEGDK